MHADVVIIGAGISGLAALTELSRQGIRPLVFEARERLGGRIRTYRPEDGGPVVELGAQVIHGDRNPLRAPPDGWPVSTLPAHPIDRRVAARAVLDGRVVPIGALAAGRTPPWQLEERLTAGGAADEPLATWLAATGPSREHAEWFRQVWAADPEQLSARGVAVARRADAALGTGEYQLEGGFGALVGHLAAGQDIRLGRPVHSLTWEPGRVEVGVDGEPITARAAVVTVPPAVVAADRLSISPLPAPKAAAATALRAGDGWCGLVELSRPAPESAVVFDAGGRSGFVRCTAGRPEVLVVAKAGAAKRVRTGDVAGLVARALPAAAGPTVTVRAVADWGCEPWSAGAFSYPAVGALWASPVWAAPLSNTIFFAGEATNAAAGTPSVHGALESGLRAARELLEVWQ